MKKICVIGAGPSGIAAVKQLKDEGHDVQCFEKGATIGGVFTPKGSAYDSCLLTISNHFMAYSDFMPVEERLHFWTRNDYFRYLKKYAEKFDLFPHIQTNTTVEKTVKQNGKWQVHIKQGEAAQTLTFDKLVVCTGAYQKPNIPTIAGIEEFKGDIYHAQEYRNNQPFTGRKVLCVGMGETSADLTTEISDVAEKCIVSVRRYQQIAVRYPHGSNTIDTYTTRMSNTISRFAEGKFAKKVYRNFFKRKDPAMHLVAKWSLAALGADPLSHQVITKNERLFAAIADCKAQANITGIKQFEGNKVIFNDEVEEEINTIVWCTGFKLEFPFLPEALRFTDPRNLYKHIFHPQADDSLAFVGFTRPLQGGVPVISEMQSRYVSQVFGKKAVLPDKEDMKKMIARDKQREEKEFSITPHVKGLVNYSHYIEVLAQLVKCCPEIPFFKDMRLCYKLFFMPHLAIQYRISGPHALTEEAKKIIRSYPIALTRRQQLRVLFFYLLGKVFPYGKYKLRMTNRLYN